MLVMIDLDHMPNQMYIECGDRPNLIETDRSIVLEFSVTYNPEYR